MQVPADDDPFTELIVNGSIYPDQESDIAVEVRRGMIILTNEGQEAGRVAAVIVDKHDQVVTHIVLSRISQIPEYRLVPVSIIEQVYDEKVVLRIFNQVVNTLPTWHGS